MVPKYQWIVSIKCSCLCASNSKSTNKFVRYEFLLQRHNYLFLPFTSFKWYWNFFFKVKTDWEHSILMAYAWWCISSSCSAGVRKRPFRVWCCWFWLRSEHSYRCNCSFPELHVFYCSSSECNGHCIYLSPSAIVLSIISSYGVTWFLYPKPVVSHRKQYCWKYFRSIWYAVQHCKTIAHRKCITEP